GRSPRHPQPRRAHRSGPRSIVAAVTAGVAGSYRRLFAEPVLRRLAVADVCARLPQGMMSITLLLVAAQHASMALAGLALAGYRVGAAGTAPVRGRLADRSGLFPVAAVCLVGWPRWPPRGCTPRCSPWPRRWPACAWAPRWPPCSLARPAPHR